MGEGMNSFDQAFHQVLDKQIQELIVRRSMDLGAGCARAEDSQTTAMRYATQTGYISALGEVRGMCQDIMKEMLKVG